MERVKCLFSFKVEAEKTVNCIIFFEEVFFASSFFSLHGFNCVEPRYLYNVYNTCIHIPYYMSILYININIHARTHTYVLCYSQSDQRKRRSVCEFGIICSRPVVVGHCDHAHKHGVERNLMRNNNKLPTKKISSKKKKKTKKKQQQQQRRTKKKYAEKVKWKEESKQAAK